MGGRGLNSTDIKIFFCGLQNPALKLSQHFNKLAFNYQCGHFTHNFFQHFFLQHILKKCVAFFQNYIEINKKKNIESKWPKRQLYCNIDLPGGVMSIFNIGHGYRRIRNPKKWIKRVLLMIIRVLKLVGPLNCSIC